MGIRGLSVPLPLQARMKSLRRPRSGASPDANLCVHVPHSHLRMLAPRQGTFTMPDIPGRRNARPRMTRERRTVAVMIALYCRDHHRSEDTLCPECSELMGYAHARLDKCPFGEGKTTCARCPVHCYRPAMRERIRTVMRYAGPRMILRHPVLALRHLIDGWRKEPVRTPRQVERSAFEPSLEDDDPGN